MLIQIYEISSPDEARAVSEIGIDHVGVLVGDGEFPREQPPARAAEIAAAISGPAKLSALFLTARANFILEWARRLKPAIVHLGVAPELLGRLMILPRSYVMSSNREPIPTETARGPQRLASSRFAPANRRRLSAPALRTFLAIADLWALTEKQRLLVLGYPSRSTYHNWCKKAREHGAITLDVDVLTRISAVLGIHQALGILFPQERLGVDWLRSPHNAVVFGGHPPFELITSGSQDGLLTVRRFLSGARGGLYMQPNAIDQAFTPYDEGEIAFR